MFLIAVAFILANCSFAYAQSRTNRIYRPCPSSTSPAKLEIDRNGNIAITPCVGKTTSVGGASVSAAELHLLDPAYTPSFSARSYLTVGTDTRVTVPTADSLIGSDISLPVTVSGTNKFYVGSNVDLDFQGTTTNPTIFGSRAAIFSNSLSPAGTGTMIGTSASVDVGGPVLNAIGGSFSAATGSSGAAGTDTVIGVSSLVSVHNAGMTNLFAGDFWVASSPSVPASTATNAYGLRVRARANNGVTFTNLRFLSLAESSLSGTGSVGTSYGIYADSTIDLGATRYFIHSTSTSPSRFAGDVRISDTTKGIILTSPDGTCYRFTVANGGAFSAGAAVTCQ